MILTELIKEQAFQCVVMLGAGVVIGILYQVYRNTCSLLRLPQIAGTISELAFWVAAAAATSQFLYYCAYGRLSFHAAVAFGVGLLLWKSVFCDIINCLYANLDKIKRNRNRDGKEETQQPIQRHQSGDRH